MHLGLVFTDFCWFCIVFSEVFGCFKLVLLYVWGHTEANEDLRNAVHTVCRWPQRFEWMDRSRISGMDRFEESTHADGAGFGFGSGSGFVQAGSIRLGS